MSKSSASANTSGLGQQSAYRKPIQERADYLKRVREKTDQYVARAGNIIAGYNPQIIDEYNATNAASILDTITRLLDQHNKFAAAANGQRPITAMLQNGFDIYAELGKAFASISVAIAVFKPDTYLRAATEGLSSTAVSDIYNDRDFVLDAAEWWRRREIAEDTNIVSALLTGINIRANSAIIIGFIREQSTVNKFTVELLRKMAAERVRSRVVSDLIDAEKDLLLGAGRIVAATVPAPQQPLVRFGLIPFTISMPLGGIVDVMTRASGTSKASLSTADDSSAAPLTREQIENAFSQLHHQVVVIDCSRSVGVDSTLAAPTIEFDARGLISLDYLTENDLLIKRNSGLTKKILVRYNTVRDVAAPENYDIPKIQSPIFTIGDATSHVFVVQMLTPIRFKLLSNNSTALVNRSTVRGLFAGISTRAAEYARICEDIILSKIYDPGSANIQVLYAEATNLAMPADALKANISRDFSIHFESALEKKMPTNNAHFVRLLANEGVIVSILTRRLVAQLGRPSTEFLLTYMYKFDALSRQFVRELVSRAKRHQPSALSYRELRPTELKRHLYSICMTAVDEAINELDRAKQWDEIDKSLKEFFIERRS